MEMKERRVGAHGVFQDFVTALWDGKCPVYRGRNTVHYFLD